VTEERSPLKARMLLMNVRNSRRWLGVLTRASSSVAMFRKVDLLVNQSILCNIFSTELAAVSGVCKWQA
jgi:hypothetical protein